MIIGLDVGGTHTDVILLGPDGPRRKVKVITDHDDLFATLLEGLESATQGIDPRKIQRVVLSTTLATNLVTQNLLPPVGMVAASGPGIDPQFFRTNDHYHTVGGAMDHRGRETEPPDLAAVRAAGESFQAQGIEFAGVAAKFSVRNPAHEIAMARELTPFVRKVFLGHQISGHLNFPRRIATTYLNAAVYPVHKRFFQAVRDALAKKGFAMPICILKPDGGHMNLSASLDFPAQTILSGPAASVMGAVAHADGNDTSLVLDIGGTTTDMAVLLDGVPLLDPLGVEVGPYKTLIRALQTRSMGVGGDSEVRIEDGRPVIGPRRRGPAMAYGGPAPTPTDAFCVLGLTEEGDRDRARQGITPLAQSLGLDIEAAAEAIFVAACRRILDGADEMIAGINAKPVYTVHELWKGSRIAPTRILVLGGPAPQFASRFAKLFDGRVDVVPHWQVANAIGCAMARTTCEVTLFADTALRLVTAPEENFNRKISDAFELEDARELAIELLRAKALRLGADTRKIEVELLEASTFNMIRGFNTVGRNIRVRAQIKPGLIRGVQGV